MKKIALMLGVSLFSLVGLAQANLVTNGDFETGDLTGWTAPLSNTICCGVTDPLVLDVGPGNGNGIFGAPSYLGNFVANFGAGGGTGGNLSQTIATTAGQTYSLSFDYGGFQSAAFGEPQSLNITAGGVSLGTVTSTGGSGSGELFDVFSHYNESFTATGSSTTLTFSDVSSTGDSSDGMLDNVNVAAGGVTPEPGYFMLVAGGLGILGLVANRRRRKAALVSDSSLS